MEMSYTTNRYLLKVLNSTDAGMVLDFFINNKEHFKKWDPIKVNNFYTLTYQAVMLSFEYSKIISRDMLRLWIFNKEDPQKVIGTFSFTNIQRGITQSCILGYKLDQDNEGVGCMTEVLLKGIDVIFREYNLHRIESLVMPSNHKSIRLLERLGFDYEGLSKKLYKIDNVWEDHARYSLINFNHH